MRLRVMSTPTPAPTGSTITDERRGGRHLLQLSTCRTRRLVRRVVTRQRVKISHPGTLRCARCKRGIHQHARPRVLPAKAHHRSNSRLAAIPLMVLAAGARADKHRASQPGVDSISRRPLLGPSTRRKHSSATLHHMTHRARCMTNGGKTSPCSSSQAEGTLHPHKVQGLPVRHEWLPQSSPMDNPWCHPNSNSSKPRVTSVTSSTITGLRRTRV